MIISVLSFSLMSSASAMEMLQGFNADMHQSIVLDNGMTLVVRPLYVGANAAPPVIGAGGALDGVALLTIDRGPAGMFLCSGALLTSGVHVLTAAHCLTDANGNFDAVAIAAAFEGAGGVQSIQANIPWTMVHPGWTGNLLFGNDLAVIELVSAPTADIDRYDIDRNGADDVGSIPNKVGYGQSGVGATGADPGNFPAGFKRQGNNLYDALGDSLLSAPPINFVPGVDFVAGSQLQYDFDNGLVANDAFDVLIGLANLGLGDNEAMSAPGDSGGPSFNGIITGVTSYGLTFIGGNTPDIDGGAGNLPNSSFGEFGGDTRVSFYANWIDGIVNQNKDAVGGEFLPLNTVALLLAGVQTNVTWIATLLVSITAIGLVLARRM